MASTRRVHSQPADPRKIFLALPMGLEDANDIPDVKVEPELLALAQHILKTKEAKFDPTRFVDRYEQAVVEMLQQKQAGLPATVKTFPPPRAVPDLMEAFRKSLAAVQAETANDDGKPAKAARPKKPRPRSRASGKCCCRSRGENRGRSKACEGAAAEGGLRKWKQKAMLAIAVLSCVAQPAAGASRSDTTAAEAMITIKGEIATSWCISWDWGRDGMGQSLFAIHKGQAALLRAARIDERSII